jgi:hypothetical protein
MIDGATKYDYAHWMQKHIATDKSIFEIAMISTHNAGIYSGYTTIGWKCQDLDIGQQLERGVRSFDLRVAYSNMNQEFLMAHAGSYPGAGFTKRDRQDYVTALEMIRTFIDSTKEFVVLLLTFDPADEANPEARKALGQLLLDTTKLVLGNLIYDKAVSTGLTYGALIDSSRRIIVAISETKGEFLAPPWAQTALQLRHSNWEDAQSDWKKSESDKLALVLKNGRASFAERAATIKAGTRDAVFQVAAFNVWTLNIGLYAQDTLNPAVAELLAECIENPAIRKGINLVEVDFFDLPDQRLVNAVIKCNIREGRDIRDPGLI